MKIERNNDKIQITVSSNLDSFSIQRIIDYLKYLEATSLSNASQGNANELADETNDSWWRKNKNRFLK